MYVPAKSGHTKHTIKNFILNELKMYVRYNTVEHIFFKIWNTYIASLRNCGYKKVPLKKLLRCVQFADRMNLLTLSQDKLDFRKISNTEVECVLIVDGEHIFKGTFSKETY